MLAPMRPVFLVTAALLAGCASPQQPAPQAKTDPTAESWYGMAVVELAASNSKAEALFAAGRRKQAAVLVTESQSLQKRLLAVPQPTLAAMVSASDLDDLYGRMLMADGRYGFARLEFQKDLIRWKNWKPQTAETVLRFERARSAIAACDRRLAK